MHDCGDTYIENKCLFFYYFEGDFYDAYSVLLDIFSIARQEIIIIDNYFGKELLDILKNIKRKVIIVSKNIDEV